MPGSVLLSGRSFCGKKLELEGERNEIRSGLGRVSDFRLAGLFCDIEYYYYYSEKLDAGPRLWMRDIDERNAVLS